LKEVRVNCSDPDPILFSKLHDLGGRLARAKIPEHMYRDRGANPGKGVDLPGIGQLVIDIDRGSVLEKLAEASTGVGKAPTWGLDAELIERQLNSLVLRFVHTPGGGFVRNKRWRRSKVLWKGRRKGFPRTTIIAGKSSNGQL